MVISQGDVFWLTLAGVGSEPRGRRPVVVVQHDRYNRSAISTTVVVAVTSNLRLAAMPGNVRLSKGEGGLPRASVINVTQLVTLDKSRLTEQGGKLAPRRVQSILDGLGLVFGIEPE
ncbi:MAG: type II toxin-antitoxin system PemK/MazF family toxin [Deltaproteobacteria bacterium]|nr:type II toxin-antitoxin system PemK/MazF family toxin [Deltaproteobacteria bacterium]MBW1870948.1 type II toxin-antitoxin system PemK/MazF family toxin [Deltaproteobacteria bacterium]